MQTAPWVVFDLVGVLAGPSWRALEGASDASKWELLKRGCLPESDFWRMESALTYRQLLRYDSAMVSFVERLHARRVRTALATNFCCEWLDALMATHRLPFDACFVSSQLGVAKPEKAFWKFVRGVVPAGSILIDDKLENCVSARTFDLRSVQMVTVNSAIERVEQLLAASH